MTDAEKIAAGLSKAQREAFAGSMPGQMHPSNEGRISTYGDRQVGHELFALGLTEKPGTFSFATPLGLAVRAILQSQAAQGMSPEGELYT